MNQQQFYGANQSSGGHLPAYMQEQPRMFQNPIYSQRADNQLGPQTAPPVSWDQTQQQSSFSNYSQQPTNSNIPFSQQYASSHSSSVERGQQVQQNRPENNPVMTKTDPSGQAALPNVAVVSPTIEYGAPQFVLQQGVSQVNQPYSPLNMDNGQYSTGQSAQYPGANMQSPTQVTPMSRQQSIDLGRERNQGQFTPPSQVRGPPFANTLQTQSGSSSHISSTREYHPPETQNVHAYPSNRMMAAVDGHSQVNTRGYQQADTYPPEQSVRQHTQSQVSAYQGNTASHSQQETVTQLSNRNAPYGYQPQVQQQRHQYAESSPQHNAPQGPSQRINPPLGNPPASYQGQNIPNQELATDGRPTYSGHKAHMHDTAYRHESRDRIPSHGDPNSNIQARYVAGPPISNAPVSAAPNDYAINDGRQHGKFPPHNHGHHPSFSPPDNTQVYLARSSSTEHSYNQPGLLYSSENPIQQRESYPYQAQRVYPPADYMTTPQMHEHHHRQPNDVPHQSNAAVTQTDGKHSQPHHLKFQHGPMAHGKGFNNEHFHHHQDVGRTFPNEQRPSGHMHDRNNPQQWAMHPQHDISQRAITGPQPRMPIMNQDQFYRTDVREFRNTSPPDIHPAKYPVASIEGTFRAMNINQHGNYSQQLDTPHQRPIMFLSGSNNFPGTIPIQNSVYASQTSPPARPQPDFASILPILRKRPGTSYKKMKLISEELVTLEDDVLKFNGRPGDKEALYLEERLTQKLIALDDVAVIDDETRHYRKTLILGTQQLLSYIER